MTPTLESHYEDLLLHVPTGPVGDASFAFSKQSIGPPPDVSATHSLVVRPAVHEYSASFRPEFLYIDLETATSRSLGCLIAATLFHGSKGEIRLELTNPKSSVRAIAIEFAHPNIEDQHPGLATVPLVGTYYPDDPAKHPWLNECTAYDLPWFELTNEKRVAITEAERKARDLVVVSGNDQGLWRLAELLLDAGRPDCSQKRFDLECEAGFLGVAPRSAEVAFSLPGSYSFLGLDPDD